MIIHSLLTALNTNDHGCSDSNSEVIKTLYRIEDSNTRMEMNRTNDLQQLKVDLLASLKSMNADAELGRGLVKDHFHKVLELRSVSETDVAKFSERLDQLSSQLSALAHKAKNIAAEQALLNSLRFRPMKDRFANISESVSKTFDWLFDASDSKQQVGSRFTNWLQNKSGVFWIEGKASSGKSTIMKYLCNNEKTTEKLRQWSNGRQLVLTSFFFWSSGTTLQKSQHSLLRSLLYEILRQCPDLIHIVCPRYAVTSQDWASDSWNLEELVDILNKVRDQGYLAANFTFFIDGLDEYEGDYNELINVIQELAEHPNMNICASSRPYYAFKDAFGQASERQLTLKDYTENDIREYVELCFRKSPRFETLRKLDSRYSNFIQEVVDKAQGVFLWVALVVRSLLKGFTNADDIPDLQRRLRELPPTLEGVFRQMFDRIEPVYHEQTARIFMIALIAPELSLMALSFLDDERLCNIQYMRIRPLTPKEVTERFGTMQRRLAGRCDGLLEVPFHTEEWVVYFFAPVIFMHKSVRDFLLLKDLQTMLSERAGLFDARETLCKAILAQMKSLPKLPPGKIEPPLEALFRNMAHTAREMEIENNTSPVILLNEAEKVFREHPTAWKWRRKKSAFLDLAIQLDLQLYAEARLNEQPNMIDAGPRPLLSYALEPYNISIVKMLLSKGASPEQRFMGHSVWYYMITSDLVTYSKSFVPRSDTELLQISRLMISHGANVHQDILIENMKNRANVSGRAAATYQSHMTPVYKSALELLVGRLGSEEVERMLQRAPKSSNTSSASFLSRLNRLIWA